MTNLFGFGIDGLEVPFFLVAARVTFVFLSLLAAVLVSRRTDDKQIGRVVLGVTLAGFFLAWLATMFPLPNVYGANGSQDRENHLGWTNVVALGFSPLRTFQVNHIHFEPVWPLLTALATGFNVDRVALVFQLTPLVMGFALALSISFAWLRGQPDSEHRHVEAAFAALGALLLLAVPGDSTGIFRNPWALSFLLKPNHVLGLVLTPLAALALARAKNWKSRLLAGFTLQLVGWAFVIHMALFIGGLAVFVGLSWVTRCSDRRRDLIDTISAIGINLVIVSPYLFILVTGYSFIHGSDSYRLSFFSERPFEGPLRLGALALLSGFGAWRAYHGGGRLGRILGSQWLAAQLIWQLFPLLGLIGQAREQDEALYWCRFWTGLFAGVGVFQFLLELTRRRRRTGLAQASRFAGPAAALSLLLLLPSMLPTWWDPLTMDQYFLAALKPLPAWIDEPTRFIRAETPTNAVFSGDRNYAKWIAAYGQRRVLLANSMNQPADTPLRMDLEEALLHNGPAPVLEAGLARYGVQYLLLTSSPLERDPTVTVEKLQSYGSFDTVFDRVFPNTRVTILRVHGNDVAK